MAATWSASMSTKTTAWRARTSAAPIVPPIAPAPQTRIGPRSTASRAAASSASFAMRHPSCLDAARAPPLMWLTLRRRQPPSMFQGLSGNLRGGALMAAAAILFAAEALAIRLMTARGIPVEVQVFARSLGQLVWVAPIIAATGLAVFRTQRPGLHLLRGSSSLLTWGFYYASFGPLDLATATVLSFTNVMFTTLLAGPVLGERVDRWRWAGTIAGFVGVAVMLRPGTTVSMLGVALALGVRGHLVRHHAVLARAGAAGPQHHHHGLGRAGDHGGLRALRRHGLGAARPRGCC